MIAALLAALAVTPSPFVRPTMRPRDAISMYVEGEATPDGYVATFASMVAGFSVDPAKLHVDIADAGGALLARDVPHDAAAPDVRNGPPGPNETVRMHLSVPRTALRTGMQTLIFRADRGVVSRQGEPVDLAASPFGLSVRVYVPDTAHDAALQRRYAGATVYAYGPISLKCTLRTIPFATLITKPHAALRVAAVRRATGEAALLRAGSSESGASDYAFAYKAIDPLEIAFDPAHRPAVAGTSFAIPATPGQRVPPSSGASRGVTDEIATSGCRTLTVRAGGAWDLEQRIASGAPAAVAPDVRIGMTHEQVAYVVGFPSVYATKAELLRMPEWRYDRPAPFSAVVTFEGDRVVKYQPPGQLP